MKGILDEVGVPKQIGLVPNNFFLAPWGAIAGGAFVKHNAIKPLFEARAEYINAAFNEIQSRYKDIEEFVVNELNIDFDVIDRIKNKILE